MMAGIAVAAADPIPGMAICLVQSSLVFFNIDYVRDRIRWIVNRQSPSTRWFILDGEAVTTIDSTAAAFRGDQRRAGEPQSSVRSSQPARGTTQDSGEVGLSRQYRT